MSLIIPTPIRSSYISKRHDKMKRKGMLLKSVDSAFKFLKQPKGRESEHEKKLFLNNVDVVVGYLLLENIEEASRFISNLSTTLVRKIIYIKTSINAYSNKPNAKINIMIEFMNRAIGSDMTKKYFNGQILDISIVDVDAKFTNIIKIKLTAGDMYRSTCCIVVNDIKMVNFVTNKSSNRMSQVRDYVAIFRDNFSVIDNKCYATVIPDEKKTMFLHLGPSNSYIGLKNNCKFVVRFFGEGYIKTVQNSARASGLNSNDPISETSYKMNGHVHITIET